MLLDVSLIAGSTVNTDNPGCQTGVGAEDAETTAAVMEENWDDDILDLYNDTSPFGT